MSHQLRASKRRYCWASITYNPTIKELKNDMLQSISTVHDFSRGSSRSSSQSSANAICTCLIKIRDFCMRSENVSDFEPVENFIKKENTDQLKLHDIIQYDCKNKQMSYYHWGLYVGFGKIIHFGPENGGTVKMDPINYSTDNYPCRVNNLTKYVKKRGYTERSETDITITANIYLEMKNFPYNLLAFNCGHMVTLWKYGVPFNPEVCIISI
jgi:hypothetical protein